MVTAGEILGVEVQTVAVFGLFCRAGEQEMLVLIPEISWVASFGSCRQFAEPGDRFRVRVIHVDAERGKVSASIKGLYSDPWSSGLLAPGTLHEARVVRRIESADRCDNQPGYLLELLPGAYVVLCGGPPLVIGQSCPVRVVASDFSKRAVRVALADHRDAASS